MDPRQMGTLYAASNDPGPTRGEPSADPCPARMISTGTVGECAVQGLGVGRASATSKNEAIAVAGYLGSRRWLQW